MSMSEEEIQQCTIFIMVGNIKFNYYNIFTFCYELSTETIFHLSLTLLCSSKLLSGSMA